MNQNKEEINLQDMGEFCFINGQRFLHETEEAFYKWLVSNGFTPLVLDDLFEHPEKITAIKLFNPSTIVLGTTGTYKEKIDKVLLAFEQLNWLPKNAIFTMGSEYFSKFSDLGVNGYKIYPYAAYFKHDPHIKQLESY